MGIQFTDVCFITNDVFRLRAFYEAVFDVEAECDEIHSGISMDGLALVFDHVDIADDNPTFRYVSAGGANNARLASTKRHNILALESPYSFLQKIGYHKFLLSVRFFIKNF
jgi:hypothetical protein